VRSVVVDTAQSGTWREYFNEVQRGVWQWFLVHRRIRALLVGLAALPVLVAAVSPWWQLYLRDSASWPHHVLFAVHKGVMPERGELVAFQLRQSYLDRVEPTGRPRPQLRGDTAWVKRVMGMPGDRVDVVGNDVLINGQVVAQGIGQAMYESIVYDDDGQLLTGSLMDYAVPRAGDVPLPEIHSMATLSTADFWRLRIGIGHPGERAEVSNYVLNDPRREERELIDDAMRQAQNIAPLFIEGKTEAAMLKLHSAQT